MDFEMFVGKATNISRQGLCVILSGVRKHVVEPVGRHRVSGSTSTNTMTI